MIQKGFKRKLTTILSADVVGYSRLMGDNEEATVKTITAYRELMTHLVNEDRGRVIDAKGDNLLAEFTSVVDACQCAVEIQKELKSRNAEFPKHRRMTFRIGINLGDVIEEDEAIYGDGVNIAARLEGLADPGGICISRTVYDQVKNKLKTEYDYLGEQKVKNIAEPVEAYRVVMEPKKGHKTTLSLPSKPSIAVLAFDNLSGDPAQEYLADGISESIITTLSKIPEMFVIARNSSFTYKGRAVKVQQVSEELGVRYVLEGSVIKAGDRVRITTQLIDATTGHHRWSERYDRDLADFFNLLDEIALQVGVALQVELTRGEYAWIWRKTTTNLEAWSLLVKGASLIERFSKEDILKARGLAEEAIRLDPRCSSAWTMLAYTHNLEVRLGFSESPSESLRRAMESGQKALELDDTQSEIHTFWTAVYTLQGEYDKALAEGQKSIELGPSDSLAHMLYAQTLYYLGRFEEAVALAEKSVRLSPYCPAWSLDFLAQMYRMAGRYEQAMETFQKLLDPGLAGDYNPIWTYLGLAEVCAELGRLHEAREHVSQIITIDPTFSLELVRKTSFFKDPSHLERRLAALRQAGLDNAKIKKEVQQ